MSHIVITGNPKDGFKFFGPFDDNDTALEWQDRYWFSLGGAEGELDWWVAELTDPSIIEEKDAQIPENAELWDGEQNERQE